MTDALDPTLDDILRLSAQRYGAESRYHDLPAKVVAYDRPTQTVDVQPLVLVARNATLRPVAILRQVQVRWPAGSGWSIVGDLVPGNPGWLRFAGADISAWKMQGTEQDPLAIPRSGALSDAVFEPGSQPISAPLPGEAYRVGALVIRAAELLLGDSAATDFVALAGKVLTELGAIKTAYDLHVHTETGGTTSTPTVPMTAPGSTAATKVKAT